LSVHEIQFFESVTDVSCIIDRNSVTFDPGVKRDPTDAGISRNPGNDFTGQSEPMQEPPQK